MQEILFNKNGIIPHPLIYANSDGFLGWLDMDDEDLLLQYYRFGIFPWENFGNKGAYFFPQYRYLIVPSDIKIPKSIRPYFNQGKFTVTMDVAFDHVILSCKHIKRKNQGETWISDRFLSLYHKMHQKGYAHSLEVWKGENLIGGLYGVAVGKIFTGESMFSLVSNASRFALISLALFLQRNGFKYIDCQIKNPYLEQFGGFDMPDNQFFEIMKENYFEEDIKGKWDKLFLKSIQASNSKII
jgi:leucyl/phenylalanyl-tRNA--protein transferase